MKKFITLLTAAMMLCLSFSSCSDDDGDAKPEVNGTTGDNLALFPTGYDAANVSAWYSGTKDGVNRALYLFKDGSFILTGNLDTDTKLYGIISKGTYKVSSGDYKNGDLAISPEGDKSGTMTAKDGKIEVGTDEPPMELRDIKSIPSPKNPDIDEKGNITVLDPSSAFFPEGYNASDVEAWYAFSEVQKEGTLRTTTVYLLKGNKVLTTNHLSQPDGTDRREIDFVGTYTITNGDLNNGSFKVPEMNNMENTIKDGKFTINNNVFTKQDNAKIPAATKATKDNTGNGGNG